MGQRISDGKAMIAAMAPALDPISYCFVPITPQIAPQVLGGAIATFREEEGVSAIVPAQLAGELQIEAPAFARITLRVFSDLEGVGLTAAVSGALAEAQIACNMVAALNHDHVFVPWARREEALALLQALAEEAEGTDR